jgi:hypothetical protein
MEEQKELIQDTQETEDNVNENKEENSEEMKLLRAAKIEVTHKYIEKIIMKCDEYPKLKGFKKLHELK